MTGHTGSLGSCEGSHVESLNRMQVQVQVLSARHSRHHTARHGPVTEWDPPKMALAGLLACLALARVRVSNVNVNVPWLEGTALVLPGLTLHGQGFRISGLLPSRGWQQFFRALTRHARHPPHAILSSEYREQRATQFRIACLSVPLGTNTV